MDKRIIINADDFGCCEQVNRAVELADKKGLLTSTTIMANMPAAADAIEIAKKSSHLALGVHLNLTEGKPLSNDKNIDCLCDKNGDFNYSPVLLAAASTVIHKIRKAIKIELAAQIQWVIDNGIEPTHLDSHHHLHNFPAIYPIVCDLAEQFKINSIRWPFEPKGLSRKPWPLSDKRNREKARIIRNIARMNRLQNSKFIKTDATLGITHLGKIDVNFFKAVSLYNSASVTEIMMHTMCSEETQQKQTKFSYQRKIEFETLCNERAKQYLEDVNIKLTNYRQL